MPSRLKRIVTVMTFSGFWCRQPMGLAIMGYGVSQN